MDTLLLLLAAPIFLGLILKEQYQHPMRYQKGETFRNMLLAASYQLSEWLVWFPALWVYQLLYQQRFFTLEAGPGTFLLLFVAQDFLYYWFHRCSHRCHWFWAAHVVHHSSAGFNYSTALRQSLFYPLVGMWLFWSPLALLGFKPGWIVTMVALNLAYQFFVHSPDPRSWGWLEKYFNTPSHHRVHHASHAPYLDQNFGGVLIIWDKLFGTFTPEQSPCRYGVVNMPPKEDLVTVLTHEFGMLLADIKKPQPLRLRLLRLFGRPY
ncbi:sterol desaturase family protein [Gallaecimonas xiamenensis]|uniref:Sterol desaturase protein n=1 Tax=Gallaecimonas xiamenensis 3-C-1 TaxID=745411 RepID=K2JTA9_9GAMM|nr:sterol desaturase family protein [Gallaecimonas xiamenensis]EKE68410.1 sterol desaturase protein [Gallaecimonas xiamenensis 3-C-1]